MPLSTLFWWCLLAVLGLIALSFTIVAVQYVRDERWATSNEMRELQDARAVLARTLPFVRSALRAHAEQRWWQDADLQDELEQHGLLERVRVGPDGEAAYCDADCACRVDGFDWCLRPPAIVTRTVLGRNA
jgi:hypothetical protein